MFANFELWSGGLVEHSAKPRRLRSKRGCLPCRRIKKKCDEQKPTCGLCLHHGREVCCWPKPTSPLLSTSSPGATRNAPQYPGALTQTWRSSELTLQSYRDVNRVTVLFTQPSASAVVGLPIMSKIPSNTMWELVRHANQAIHGAYFDDHYTILVPFLPVMAQFPPYMNTWLALGAIQIAQQQQTSPAQCPWRKTAIQCYSKALHGLNQHLCSSQIPHEWALSAVLLLHIFEKFGDNHEAPSDAHMNSVRSVFIRRFTQFPPSSMRHILQLESLVYRIAITSTFRPLPNAQHEYNCLDELLDIWNSSNISCGLWQHSLWISLPPQVFNLVFKLSVLLHLPTLSEAQLNEVDTLEHSLRQYKQDSVLPPSLNAADDASGNEACLSLVEQACAAQCLYYYACQTIITKLHDPSSTSSSTAIRKFSQPGFELLARLRRANFVSPVLIWPTVIIGVAAKTPEDQHVTSEYVDSLEHLSGSRTITSVRLLLKHAWEESSEGDARGLDVLSDARILASVFL